MAKAVVLLFLLDSLPGMIRVTCDPTLTAPVLDVIAKKLKLSMDSMEKLQNIELYNSHNPSYKFQELSPESLNNIGLHDNSFHESYEFSGEKFSPNFIEHNYIGNATYKEDISQPVSLLNNKSGNGSFPVRAPFLAAIFETVGNITAQTCGGVVLSEHWVLTAASCVNVLGPIYSNSSNETLDNYYSIIVGAINPLKDGTVHQVSKIYLHPAPSNGSLNHTNILQHKDLMKNWFNSLVGPTLNMTAPSLALLRIHPGVENGMLQMTENRTGWTGDARLYGWALEQHESGFETTATSMPAKQLSPKECNRKYGIPENDASMLCLIANETASNTTRINSGCPLVVLQNGRATLLAVALTDGTQPLLVTPLDAHRDWLNRITLYGK